MASVVRCLSERPLETSPGLLVAPRVQVLIKKCLAQTTVPVYKPRVLVILGLGPSGVVVSPAQAEGPLHTRILTPRGDTDDD